MNKTQHPNAQVEGSCFGPFGILIKRSRKQERRNAEADGNEPRRERPIWYELSLGDLIRPRHERKNQGDTECGTYKCTKDSDGFTHS